MRSVVLGIQLLEICVNYELFYNAQSYSPFINITPKSQQFTTHLSFFVCTLVSYIIYIDHIIGLLFNTQFIQSSQCLKLRVTFAVKYILRETRNDRFSDTKVYHFLSDNIFKLYHPTYIGAEQENLGCHP